VRPGRGECGRKPWRRPPVRAVPGSRSCGGRLHGAERQRSSHQESAERFSTALPVGGPFVGGALLLCDAASGGRKALPYTGVSGPAGGPFVDGAFAPCTAWAGARPAATSTARPTSAVGGREARPLPPPPARTPTSTAGGMNPAATRCRSQRSASRCASLTDQPSAANLPFNSSATATERCLPPVQPTATVR